MPYIGNTAADRFVASKAASVYSGDGSTTAFTLEHSVGADEDILVSVDGVIQEPSVAYAVSSGTTLTFTAAPSSNSGNNIFVYYLFRTVATVDHPATSALTATSGTFTGNIIIPNSGNIGSVGDTDAVTITSAGLVGLNNTSPSSALAVNANLNDQWAGRFENTNSGGYGVLSRTTASTTSDIAFRVDKNGSETALNVDGAGHVTMPSQPAFWVRPSSTQSNIAADGSTVTIVWGTETYDQNADFSSNTFTAPVTGKYFMHARVTLQSIDSSASYYQFNIVTSNASHSFIFDPRGMDQDTNHHPFELTAVADMDVNDTATVTILQPNGTAQTDILHTSSWTSWYGYLLG